jgi:DNA-binding IclR family transcriptional regulator
MVFVELPGRGADVPHQHGRGLARAARLDRDGPRLPRRAHAGAARRAPRSYRKVTPRSQWNEISAGIERAVRDYERYGFCLSVGEWNKDVWGVGTPMVSRDGLRILAFNCSGPIFDITRHRIIADVGPRLLALRDRVAADLGGIF